MTEQVTRVCEEHVDVFDCPDNLVHYNPSFGEYGLIVHDGGRSVVVINHCPWCGRLLPESERDAWFDELEDRHIDPWGDSVPPEYTDGTWLALRRSIPN